MDPILFKPWLSATGQPSGIPDPQGKFVSKADYDALNDKLKAASGRLAALEAHDEKVKQAADEPV
jgi:hypothetical protein